MHSRWHHCLSHRGHWLGRPSVHSLSKASSLGPGRHLCLPECLFCWEQWTASEGLHKWLCNSLPLPGSLRHLCANNGNFISRPMLELPAVGLNSNKGFAPASEVMVIFYPSSFVKTQSWPLLGTGGQSWGVRCAMGGNLNKNKREEERK